MLTNEDILQVYVDAEAILKGHFQLASGRHSDTYMQSAKLFMYPEKTKLLCGELAQKLKANGITVDGVVSPAIGGIIMGYEMANQLSVPNIYYERVNGEMMLRRGFTVEAGKRYLVVEDVVTTGGSVKEVADLVEKAGGIVECISSVVDRSNGKVDFSRRYIPLLSTEVVSWEACDCELCKKGIPVQKPGTKATQAK